MELRDAVKVALTQQSKPIIEEFAMHMDQLVAMGSPGFNVLDSYLVTVGRGVDPSPPANRPQQPPATDGAAKDAAATAAAEAVQLGI